MALLSIGRWWAARIATFALTAAAFSASALAFENPGFEDGLPGPTAPGWDLSAASDSAQVTAGDGAEFGIYADYGINVPAIFGSQSLRLGTPKQINQSQNRGLNVALSDPFVPAGNELLVTFRLFSFEHRGDDRLIFEVLDADSGLPLAGTGFAFTPRTAGNATLEQMVQNLCSAGPTCAMTIDVGKRDKRPTDSGVYKLTISLPELAPSQRVQVRYAVLAGDNEAHATWAYFDNENRPPKAVLRVNPGTAAPALEGDFVVADCLLANDPDGDALSCHFEASGGGLDPARGSHDGNLAVFWFPDEGPAAIQLTVTDAAGQTATDRVDLDLRNVDPVVNALDLEVLDGQGGETVCRWLDPGIGSFADGSLRPETHQVAASGGLVVPGSFQEEHDPAYSTGSARIAVAAGASGGACTVTDAPDDGSGSDAFSVTTVPQALLRGHLEGEAGNDTAETASPLTPDKIYLGVIDSPEDVDVYEICASISTDAGGQSVCIPPARNTELLLTLSNLPADYELLVFGQTDIESLQPFADSTLKTAPFFNIPFFNIPFFNIPFFNIQFDTVPFFNINFRVAPFFNIPFFNIPLERSPFFNIGTGGYLLGFDEVPLSATAPRPSAVISSSDINVSEVGSLNLGRLQSTPGLALKGLSAQQGTTDEQVLVRRNAGDQRILVAVIGTDGAFSTQSPYSLAVESATPRLQQDLLPPEFCAAQPDPAVPGQAKYAPSWADRGGELYNFGTETLILTQKTRFEIEQAQTAATAAAARGISVAAYWQDFWAQVGAYAAAVDGRVVSVDGALFAQADQNTCSVDLRNQLIEQIRNTYVVDPAAPAFRGDFDSVVLLGSMNIIPHRAVVDETSVGYEGDYVTDLWVRPGTPLAVSVAEGYNLTDAFLVDLVPTPYRGRSLYLEDRAVARLVESPEQIGGDLAAFLRRQAGQSDASGQVVFGYDFFCDGAQDIAELLQPSNGSYISGPCAAGGEPWNAQTLRDVAFNGGAQMCLVPGAQAGTSDRLPPLDFEVVNAHMTTYAALSAAGFASGLQKQPPGYSDVVASVESGRCLEGGMTATIGCHGGLNVPDEWRLPPEILPFDGGKDWPEELGGLFGTTGYGLGDNIVSNRGSEGILTLVVEELNRPGTTFGQAIVNAKRRYVMGLREIDPHDEDSLITLTLYAPPQWMLPQDSLAAPKSHPQTTIADESAPSPYGPLHLIVRENAAIAAPEGEIFDDLIDIQENQLYGVGTFYGHVPQDPAITGGSQAVYGRPLLPVTVPVEAEPVTGPLIHGVALVSREAPAGTICPIDGLQRPCVIAAQYVDETLIGSDWRFDPVFPLPQHDWMVYGSDGQSGILEPENCVPTLAPTQLGVASTLEQGQQVFQSLLVQGAQFRCDAFDAEVPGSLRGLHRLFTDIELTAYRPVSDGSLSAGERDTDFDPPQVLRQDVIADPVTNDVTATIRVSDALTGGSGIREVIALVFWDAADSLTGSGAVESYSAVPQCNGQLCGDLPDEFEYTFLLPNARNQRLAFQYLDGAGNLAQKSLKGSLIQAIDVQIRTTLLTGVGDNQVVVQVGEWCALPNETATLGYSIDGGEPVVLSLQDYTAEADGDGVTIQEIPGATADAPCDALITLTGLDFGDISDGQPALLTVTVRMSGAAGSDSAYLMPCADPNEPDVLDSMDIVGCAFRVDDRSVVSIDMIIAGVPDDSGVQYRLDLPDYGQFKYWDGRKVSAPGGTRLSVTEDQPQNGVGPTRIEFRISNLARLGWDGTSPVRFQLQTQSGVPGQPTQGFPDITEVFTGTP